MLKTTEIYQEHIFWVFVVFCYFLFFSKKYFKNRVKNWIATDAPSIQYLLLIIFWSHKKRRKYKKRQKNYIRKKTKKIVVVRRGCQSAQKIANNWLRKFKSKRNWNLTVYFWPMKALLTKKIQFEKEKSIIICIRTQLNFIECLIEFMEGMIARKHCF